MKAFLIMGRVIKATYEELFLVVGLSVAWWAGTLLIVTAPDDDGGRAERRQPHRQLQAIQL